MFTIYEVVRLDKNSMVGPQKDPQIFVCLIVCPDNHVQLCLWSKDL